MWGGLPPSYVLDDMKMWEAKIAMDGLVLRGRNEQEAIRNNTTCILQILGADGTTSADVFPRPWDDVDDAEDTVTYEDLMKASEVVAKEINNGSDSETSA